MNALDLNESRSFVVHSKVPWNETGVTILPGQKYKFQVTAECDYRDWNIRATPDGFENPRLKLLEFLRRARNERWFCLMGSIGRDPGVFFRVGSSCENYSPGVQGELFLFANDAHGFYFNNHGHLEVCVTRTA